MSVTPQREIKENSGICQFLKKSETFYEKMVAAQNSKTLKTNLQYFCGFTLKRKSAEVRDPNTIEKENVFVR